jgi:hypothetical protein
MNITLTNEQAAVLPTNIVFVDVLTLILNPENKSAFLTKFHKEERDHIHRKLELLIYTDHNGVLRYLLLGKTSTGMVNNDGLNALFIGCEQIPLPHKINKKGCNIENDTHSYIELIKQIIEHNTAYIVSKN